MEFQKTRISSSNEPENKPYRYKKAGIIASIAGLIILIGLLGLGIAKAISSIDFKVVLKAAGDELQKDAFGHTNILIMGKAGKNNEGADLTDTILVASLDQDNKTITMVSIPRDLYIKDALIGNSKINEVNFNANKHFQNKEEGLRYTKNKIEELTGSPIHYWIMVDFEGFVKIVDIFGGIDVVVEEAIYDVQYPKDGTYIYEPFKLSAGAQHLDGKTALKYVRSRKSTSDFDRARRQQQTIYALKEKALESKIIFDQNKISEIFKTLKENIVTNITPKEILTFGAIAGEYNKDKIIQRLMHDDPRFCGGLLYTPERQYYDGMFVLLTAGGLDFLHRFMDLNFNYPLVNHENLKIQILNGTSKAGVASNLRQILNRYCLNINRYGNAKNLTVTETTYYYKEQLDETGKPINKKSQTLDFLLTMIPGKISTQIPQEYAEYMLENDLIIEIGSDYVNSGYYLIDPFIYLYSLPLKSETTNSSSDTDTTEGTGTDASTNNGTTDTTNEPTVPDSTPTI